MAKSVFVVMENNFEYTDEYYYSTGGGEPVKAFLDLATAREYADSLTRNFVSEADEHQLAEYFQGASQGSWDESTEMARKSVDERMAFAKEVGLDVFHVTEVTIEDEAVLEDSKDFDLGDE